MKTRTEIEDLKRQWVADPCWEIELTEGFEDHCAELAEFARTQRGGWELRFREMLTGKAEHMGVPGNLTLAAYIVKLEDTIAQLRIDIDTLKNR